MGQLFPRDWRVQVDTLDISTLEMEFKVLSTLKSTANRCSLTVFNLNADHRAQFLKRARPGATNGIATQIDAGYVNARPNWFIGDLRQSSAELQAADNKITLAGDDSGRALREGRINMQLAKGQPIGNAIRQCVSAIGLGAGNSADFEANASINAWGTTLPSALTLSGSAAKSLSRLLASVKLTWSVQRGVVQILQIGQPLNTPAIVLSPSTGLLASPQAAIDATVSLGNPNSKTGPRKPKARIPGIIKFKAMPIAGLYCGKKVTIKSENLNGGYYITETELNCQTWASGSWEVNCVARVY